MIDYMRSPSNYPALPSHRINANEDPIPENFARIAYAFHHRTGAAFNTIHATMIVALAGVFSPLLDVEGMKGKAMPLSSYELVAAETGEGKSTVMSAIFDPINRVSAELTAENKKNTEHFDIELLKWKNKKAAIEKALAREITQEVLADGEGESPKTKEIEQKLSNHLRQKPVQHTISNLVYSSTTMAGLRDALQNNFGTVIVANADAGQLITDHLMKFTGEYCAAWSGEKMNIRQKLIQIDVDNPRLSMLLMVQPHFIEDFFESGHKFRTSGLAARFIIHTPESMLGKKHLFREESTSDTQYIDEWAALLTNQLRNNRERYLGNEPPQRDIIRLPYEVVDFFSQRAIEIDFMLANGGIFVGIRDLGQRIIELACRRAALYELLRDPEARSISLQMAISAYNYVINYAYYYLSLADPNKPRKSVLEKAEIIMKHIRSSSKLQEFYADSDPINRTRLIYRGMFMEDFQKTAPMSVRKKADYEHAMNLLETEGRVGFIDAYQQRGYKNTVRKKVVLLKDETPRHTVDFFSNF
ncbi:DUF3987 domain-containing protein [Acidithiobacillus ferrooxidans]